MDYIMLSIDIVNLTGKWSCFQLFQIKDQRYGEAIQILNNVVQTYSKVSWLLINGRPISQILACCHFTLKYNGGNATYKFQGETGIPFLMCLVHPFQGFKTNI